MCGLPLISDPNLIVGIEKPDDAAVYKLNNELALIQTVDFITPVVDDPFTFGQIAAANSMSDIWAMGGKPLTAMNIVCFPVKTLEIAVLKEILRGGLDKMREAGVLLVGGHSVEDNELKYGLSVTGTVHPQHVTTRAGAKPGNLLILTKPLGIGILSTALKGGILDSSTLDAALQSMTLLNKEASELMQQVGADACTDITGFGLLGHACEMCLQSGVGMRIDVSAVPLLPRVAEFAQKGVLPGGAHRNKEFRLPMVEVGSTPDWLVNVLFDPQTSGGLFIAAPPPNAHEILSLLHQRGHKTAAIIGQVVEQPKGRIILA